MTAQALQWGTVSSWAGNLLTGGSLLLGFYILLRDRRKEERAQAQRVVFETYERETARIDDPSVIKYASFGVTVNNLSDSYIYAVTVRAQPKARRVLRRQPMFAADWNLRASQLNYIYALTGTRNEEHVRDGRLRFRYASMLDSAASARASAVAELPRIPPGERTVIVLKLYFPSDWYDIVVEFMDASGRWWYREVYGGKFVKPPRMPWLQRHAVKRQFKDLARSDQRLIEIK